MPLEEIVDKLGENFDEVRRNQAKEGPRFTCYLTDYRRFSGETIREALEQALNANENTQR